MARDWIERNKGFVLTFLVLFASICVAFATTQSTASQNSGEIKKIQTAMDQFACNQQDTAKALVEVRVKLEALQDQVSDQADAVNDAVRKIDAVKDLIIEKMGRSRRSSPGS